MEGKVVVSSVASVASVVPTLVPPWNHPLSAPYARITRTGKNRKVSTLGWVGGGEVGVVRRCEWLGRAWRAKGGAGYEFLPRCVVG